MNEETNRQPDQVIELHSDRDTVGHADLPNGGRIKVAEAGSDKQKPEELVFVELGDRRLRRGQEALLPAGSFGVKLYLRIDRAPPNRPKPPNSWYATVHVFRD